MVIERCLLCCGESSQNTDCSAMHCTALPTISRRERRQAPSLEEHGNIRSRVLHCTVVPSSCRWLAQMALFACGPRHLLHPSVHGPLGRDDGRNSTIAAAGHRKKKKKKNTTPKNLQPQEAPPNWSVSLLRHSGPNFPFPSFSQSPNHLSSATQLLSCNL